MCALDQLIDLRQVRLGIGAENLNDARQRVGGGRQIENQATVVYEPERERWQRQRVRRDHGDDRPEFRLRAPQEFAARGNIFEELADDDRRAAIARRRSHLTRTGERIALDLDGALRQAVECREREARDTRDRRQRLAAEAEGPDARQIVEGADLRSRVTLECQQRIVARHPRSVVPDLDPLLAAVFEEDLDRARAGVDGILDELLDSRCRPLDHFSGRDLIHELGGENQDVGHL